ncbi:hypothetical protein [Legionella impletisoli]|uniref:Transmembrane protein n=1 Tax=Legionella impletisoli TaxID=343510 RepID=A0A917JT06_9GAMM|nr:hypothetical protein [Legionella impletisoli]GGI82399.1 hypothetical protein GCM10007966_08730 [Legionella impletisoli]
MLISAVIFFALAALLGLYLLSFILRDKNTPKMIAFLHGPLAGIGIVLLILYAYYNTQYPLISIILFILAALGGIMMLYKDLSGHSIPKAMAIGHGITAIIAFCLLLIFVFL